jgi:GT2 family glycosyltransferase
MITAHFPDVHVISNSRNHGFAKANNQGLAVAQGRYYLLLNSDTIVPPGSLDGLVCIADAHPELGVIGPKILNMNGTLQESWSTFPTIWSELVGRNFRHRRPVANSPLAYEVDWVMGACMLVRAETAAQVGMLDEDYFFYSEEADWCYRIKNKGWKIWYVAQAEIYHLGGGSTKKHTLTQLTLLYENKIRYFKKNHGSTQATLLRYGLALSNCLGLIRRIFLFTPKDRIQVQSQLIRCLLLDKYPAIQQ